MPIRADYIDPIYTLDKLYEFLDEYLKIEMDKNLYATLYQIYTNEPYYKAIKYNIDIIKQEYRKVGWKDITVDMSGSSNEMTNYTIYFTR